MWKNIVKSANGFKMALLVNIKVWKYLAEYFAMFFFGNIL